MGDRETDETNGSEWVSTHLPLQQRGELNGYANGALLQLWDLPHLYLAITFIGTRDASSRSIIRCADSVLLINTQPIMWQSNSMPLIIAINTAKSHVVLPRILPVLVPIAGLVRADPHPHPVPIAIAHLPPTDR